MNMDPDTVQLESYDHLNRAQKRAFIMRDQLKYTEPHHLDVFLEGIGNPEPPAYKRTSSGIHPPYEEVTIKDSAKSFDVGNVELRTKEIARIVLKVSNDEFLIVNEEMIPKDKFNLQSVPVNYMVVYSMLPHFKSKYEAIYSRMLAINELRRHAFEEARNKPPKTPTRFKESESFANLMNSMDGVHSCAIDEEHRKRPGELISRHPLNKKKRIGVDHIRDDVKVDSVNRLSDQTKVDLFNTFIKSAFPEFDTLLMASWNVVSVYCCVGTEDRMLHNSIGELNEVLQKFEDQYTKSGKTRVNTGGAASRKEIGSAQKPNGSTQEPPSVRLLELQPRKQEDEDQNVPAVDDEEPSLFVSPGPPTTPPQANTHSEDEHRPRPKPHLNRLTQEYHPKQSSTRRPEPPKQSSSTQPPSRSRIGGHPLPQNHADLFKKHPSNNPRLTSPRSMDITSLIDSGYAATQRPKPQVPIHAHSNKHSQTTTSTPTHPSVPHPEPPRATPEAQKNHSREQSAQRYGMFNRGGSDRRLNGDHHRNDDALENVFGDGDNEAVQTPAMQEVHEQEKADVVRKPLHLGNSMLGSLKGCVGSAPMAPMAHNSPTGKKSDRGQ